MMTVFFLLSNNAEMMSLKRSVREAQSSLFAVVFLLLCLLFFTYLKKFQELIESTMGHPHCKLSNVLQVTIQNIWRTHHSRMSVWKSSRQKNENRREDENRQFDIHSQVEPQLQNNKMKNKTCFWNSICIFMKILFWHTYAHIHQIHVWMQGKESWKINLWKANNILLFVHVFFVCVCVSLLLLLLHTNSKFI